MNKENKNHWYDGLFYDKIIAPNQDKMFSVIKSIIKPNSAILDIGCGTGRLGFKLQDIVSSYQGIDLSNKNIKRANFLLRKKSSPIISFSHADIFNYFENSSVKYDYAILTYVIHEIDLRDRIRLLKILADNAKNVIIGDYLVPRKPGFWTFLNEVVEFVAGKDHYKNYKSFLLQDGIHGLAEAGKFSIINEIKNKPTTSHIVVLKQ